MKFIEPRVPESAAVRFFERRRFANLWGLLRRRSSAAGNSSEGERRLPCIELVWLPYYIITIKARSSRGGGEITVSVEGYSGAFAIFQMHADVVEGEVGGETFAPKLNEKEATRIARSQLLATIMRQRGGREKPVPGEVIRVELLQYPLWVYYYERRRERLDIRVLDALNGSKPGPRLKASILTAFASAKKNARP